MKTSLTNKKSKLKISVFELICYIVAGVFAIWGLVEIVLGAIALTLGPAAALRLADETYKSLFGLNMLYWGIILLVIGASLAVVVLILYAKNSDRDFEKSQRRAARLAKDAPAATTIDAKVEEVK